MSNANLPVRATLLALLATGASGGESISFVNNYRTMALTPQGYFTHTTVTQMLAADLSGNFTTDLVFRTGTELVYAYDPGRRTSFTPIPVDAVDAAVAPGQGPGSADALVVSTPTGLSKVEIDYSQNRYFQIDPLAVTGWGGATRLCVADFDADGSGALRPGVAGLDAGGNLLVATDVLGTPTTSSYTLPGTVLDVFPVNWDADAPDEVCVVGTFGVTIVDPGSGTTTSPLPVGGIGSAIGTSFRQDGYASDRAAVVLTAAAGGPDWLYVLDATGMEAPISLGSNQAYDIAAASFGKTTVSDDEDLAIAFASTSLTPQVLVLENLSDGNAPAPGTATFAMSAITVVPIAAGHNVAADQSAPLACADFGRDGDLDLAYFDEATDEFRVLENFRVNHQSTEVRLLPDSTLITVDPEAELATASLRLVEPAVIPAGANGVEINQWVQDSTSGIWREGQHRFIVDLAQLTGDWTWRPELMLWQHDIDLNLFSHLEVRLVHYTGGIPYGPGVVQEADIDAAWPITFTTYALYEDANRLLELYLQAWFGTGHHYNWDYTLYSVAEGMEPEGLPPLKSPPLPSVGFGDPGAGGGPPVDPPPGDPDPYEPPRPPGP